MDLAVEDFFSVYVQNFVVRCNGHGLGKLHDALGLLLNECLRT